MLELRDAKLELVPLVACHEAELTQGSMKCFARPLGQAQNADRQGAVSSLSRSGQAML